MVELITEILKKMIVAAGIVFLTGLLVPDILKVGESAGQSFVVLSFYVYCTVSLFTHSPHKLFFVLSIPVLTQFIHIFQKYAFTAGANSIWRLLPFMILDIYLIHFLLRSQRRMPRPLQVLILFWITAHILFLTISPNLKNIILGGIVMYLFTLPLLFTYLYMAAQATNFQRELEKYLCLLFIILGLGTFGLVYAGTGYKGSDNLLITRNIADTNITMAYFILCWPFALLYATTKKSLFLLKIGLLVIFFGVVILSFSRGAILIVLPYILLTCATVPSFIRLRVFLVASMFVYLFRINILKWINNQELLYFWQLRFADLGTPDTFLSRLETASGRTEIHHTAYLLFLKQPVWGNGIGSFEVLGPGYREAHSLWYTLLTEQGIAGTLFFYGLIGSLLFSLIHLIRTKARTYLIILAAVIFFLLFNHTVGSTWVILPHKSVTINCIAPLLLTCIYFYAHSEQR